MRVEKYITYSIVVLVSLTIVFACEAEIDDRGTENKGFTFFTIIAHHPRLVKLPIYFNQPARIIAF